MKQWIRPLALLLGITIIVFSMCDVCLADWRDGIRGIGQKIRSGTKSAIDWGAEKFKPVFQRTRKISKDGANRNYERALRAKEDPAGFVKEATVDEVVGSLRSGKEALGHLSDGNVQDAANVGCKTLADPPVPFVGQAVSPYAEAVCDELVPSTKKLSLSEANILLPDNVAGASRADMEWGPDYVGANYYGSGPRMSDMSSEYVNIECENSITVAVYNENGSKEFDLSQAGVNPTVITERTDEFSSDWVVRFPSGLSYNVHAMGKYSNQGTANAAVSAILSKIRSVNQNR